MYVCVSLISMLSWFVQLRIGEWITENCNSVYPQKHMVFEKPAFYNVFLNKPDHSKYPKANDEISGFVDSKTCAPRIESITRFGAFLFRPSFPEGNNGIKSICVLFPLS